MFCLVSKAALRKLLLSGIPLHRCHWIHKVQGMRSGSTHYYYAPEVSKFPSKFKVLWPPLFVCSGCTSLVYIKTIAGNNFWGGWKHAEPFLVFVSSTRLGWPRPVVQPVHMEGGGERCRALTPRKHQKPAG